MYRLLRLSFLFCLSCFFSLSVTAEEQDVEVVIPDAPNPPRLVNDFAGLLDDAAKEALESKLVAFSDSTSTQVCVVTVNSLGYYEISEFAIELGNKWGVGTKDKANGVVMVVKPKVGDSRGGAFIATGYGLEGALPDILCSQIVNKEMIPFFKENDYAGGIVAGVDKIIEATKGEYTADEPAGDDDGVAFEVVMLIICLIIYGLVKSGNGKSGGGGNRVTSSSRPIIYSSRSSGGWSDFSKGSGGFGGFGGGSFGGGGGGGSW